MVTDSRSSWRKSSWKETPALEQKSRDSCQRRSLLGRALAPIEEEGGGGDTGCAVWGGALPDSRSSPVLWLVAGMCPS